MSNSGESTSSGSSIHFLQELSINFKEIENPLEENTLKTGKASETNNQEEYPKNEKDKFKLIHRENNPSILQESLNAEREVPWSPRSLNRAKTAIIYKKTLNDTLFIMETFALFFQDWTPYFVSLQDDFLLLYKTRSDWEQGNAPSKIIKLSHKMIIGEMSVEIIDDHEDEYGNQYILPIRLFRRKIFEMDEIDEWISKELQQTLLKNTSSGKIVVNESSANRKTIFEFSTYDQTNFELWSKALRNIILKKKQAHFQKISSPKTPNQNYWINPAKDCKISLHQSEIWCDRVTVDDKKKIESELRRLEAMERLIKQTQSPEMALLIYEKVSRVHEMFVANSKREIEERDAQADGLSPQILNFFLDHLKRKYAVFLSLVLAFKVDEEDIRLSHEAMCEQYNATSAGVGGGGEEAGSTLTKLSNYGFDDEENVNLYERYREAAALYYELNYGDPEVANEEDAVMHLPVSLQVAILNEDHDSAKALYDILNNVKSKLISHLRDLNDEESRVEVEQSGNK